MNIKELKDKYHITRCGKGIFNIVSAIRCDYRVYRFTEHGLLRIFSHMRKECYPESQQLEKYAVFGDNTIKLYGTFCYGFLCRNHELFESIWNDTQTDGALLMCRTYNVYVATYGWDTIRVAGIKKYRQYSLVTGELTDEGSFREFPLKPKSLVVYKRDYWNSLIWYATDAASGTSYKELYKLVSHFFDVWYCPELKEKQNANTRPER